MESICGEESCRQSGPVRARWALHALSAEPSRASCEAAESAGGSCRHDWQPPPRRHGAEANNRKRAQEEVRRCCFGFLLLAPLDRQARTSPNTAEPELSSPPFSNSAAGDEAAEELPRRREEDEVVEETTTAGGPPAADEETSALTASAATSAASATFDGCPQNDRGSGARL